MRERERETRIAIAKLFTLHVNAMKVKATFQVESVYTFENAFAWLKTAFAIRYFLTIFVIFKMLFNN